MCRWLPDPYVYVCVFVFQRFAESLKSSLRYRSTWIVLQTISLMATRSLSAHRDCPSLTWELAPLIHFADNFNYLCGHCQAKDERKKIEQQQKEKSKTASSSWSSEPNFNSVEANWGRRAFVGTGNLLTAIWINSLEARLPQCIRGNDIPMANHNNRAINTCALVYTRKYYHTLYSTYGAVCRAY